MYAVSNLSIVLSKVSLEVDAGHPKGTFLEATNRKYLLSRNIR